MSIAVALERLRSETTRFALAIEVGKRSASNAGARPQVSLLWPPNQPGGYSLIVDGIAAPAVGGRIAVTPTRAVLHRPEAVPDAADEGCSADCKPILR